MNGKGLAILALLVVVTFVAADGYHIIGYPPRSIHAWRQSDCIAYAEVYYQNGNALLQPAQYYLGGKDGKVASEFPILYYLAAQICKLTGFKYWVLRSITFLCYLLGLYYLYRIVCLWISDTLTSIFPVIILATSPFYYYYGLNFLPNVPAISCSFIGLYYLLLYERSSKAKDIFIATAIIVLATLLKPTDGGLLWLAYMGVKLVQWIQGRINKKHLAPLAISALLILASMYAWYKYVAWYNDLYGNHINLQSIFPIWRMEEGSILYTINVRMLQVWFSSYHNKVLIFLLAGFIIWGFIKWRSLDRFLRTLTLFLVLGATAYNMLWYNAFGDHDYYQLLNVLPATFLAITLAEWYSRKALPLATTTVKTIMATALCLLIATGIAHNAVVQHERYTDKTLVYINQDVYEVGPYLRQWGIGPKDIVVSVPDNTTNMSLIAFGNPGYGAKLINADYNMPYFLAHGARYMIVTDSNYLKDPAYAPYTSKPVGHYKGILAFYIGQ